VGDQRAATFPTNVRSQEAIEPDPRRHKGRVDIKLFPNNQLGGDTDMLSQTRSGAIDIFVLSGLILQTLVPLAGINGLAFAFKDYDHVWGAMDGGVGAEVRAAIAKVNLHAFEKMFDNGYRNITSSTKAINSADDLKGFKIRVPVSPLWTSMFKAFGARRRRSTSPRCIPPCRPRLSRDRKIPWASSTPQSSTKCRNICR